MLIIVTLTDSTVSVVNSEHSLFDFGWADMISIYGIPGGLCWKATKKP